MLLDPDKALDIISTVSSNADRGSTEKPPDETTTAHYPPVDVHHDGGRMSCGIRILPDFGPWRRLVHLQDGPRRRARWRRCSAATSPPRSTILTITWDVRFLPVPRKAAILREYLMSSRETSSSGHRTPWSSAA